MKKWYKSKTNWLNIASVVTVILSAVSEVLPGLQGLFTLQTYMTLNAVVGVANIVLRNYFTTQAIQ